MEFIKTNIEGSYLIQLAKREDDRGNLTRIFGKDEFKKVNISNEIVQGYISFTKNKGTIRGIHYQIKPQEMAQLTRVTRGSIYEVIVDVRPNSPTYLKWQGFKLSDSDMKSLYVPKGVAHGFLTLGDDVEFINLYTAPFTAECEKGIRFNDKKFNFDWPVAVEHVSEKDSSWPDFKS